MGATPEPCGVCGRPADAVATVPMCGERPRYPLCLACLVDIDGAGYTEDVTLHIAREAP